MSHLSLIDRQPAAHESRHAAALAAGGDGAPAAPGPPERQTIIAESDLDAEPDFPSERPVLVRNGVTHKLVR
jgi:hypothetical protein